MEPIAIGDLLDGKYVIEGMLGEGAMGLVFAARHMALNKRVAVKTLRAEIARDVTLVGRFEQEARAASAIGHPNIIEVFDLGSAPSGARYMVMEYLQGESLAELITAHPYQSAERAVFLMSQVLSALGAAHKQGIVHRDLKPENIFLVRADDGPETVKLLDFGISKVLSEVADPRIAGTNSDARATRLGVVMGTPLYMAPEQARGLLDLDHRVDLWAVAVVLYELMCGRPPFAGDNYNQILGAILQGELSPPRTYCPQIAPALEALILRGMAYDPGDRFQSAADMRRALGAVLTHPEAPRAGAGNATAPSSPQRPAPSPPSAPAQPVSDQLDGFSSGALSLAGAASAESEAAMLSALDRIAGGQAE
ncbi:MAG TPA: serine/threonine-protein kinase, partial [Kofleriaceae bacterium]|nr:serine/threonine-protein kinase [Kofleriaceae bacterium]